MLSIFFIGIALSMDAFSIALGIGLNNISSIKRVIIPIIVGILHFIMPAIGLLLGNQFLKIFNFNPKIIVSIILLYLAYLMYKDKDDVKNTKISSIISIFLFAFSVSIDSFSVGLVLSGLTTHYILSFFIFALCSGSITYIGLLLGKYSVNLLKEKAVYLGIIILISLATVNLCQIFWD